MVLELPRKGRGERCAAATTGRGGRGRRLKVEKFRLTSWKCLKRRTPTSVGTRALSVSHSKFSFPTSVSTVPLLRTSSTLSLPPHRLRTQFFLRPPLSPRFRLLGVSLESRRVRVVDAGTGRTRVLARNVSWEDRVCICVYVCMCARARATLANMARQLPGAVRANLADQTGAKSRAFVRVNSIHELSISPRDLFPLPAGVSLPALCYSWLHPPPPPQPPSLLRALFLPPSPRILPPSRRMLPSPAPSTTVPIDEFATTGL